MGDGFEGELMSWLDSWVDPKRPSRVRMRAKK
jgi:hypothetical protein